MSVPASTQSLQDVFAEANRKMLQTKELLTALSTQSETENIPVRRIVNNLANLRELEVLLNTSISYGAEMLAYARDQYRDQTFAASEYTSLLTATTNFITWIESQLSDGTAVTETLSGNQVDNTFTPAQLATFRTHVATFSALIT